MTIERSSVYFEDAGVTLALNLTYYINIAHNVYQKCNSWPLKTIILPVIDLFDIEDWTCALTTSVTRSQDVRFFSLRLFKEYDLL